MSPQSKREFAEQIIAGIPRGKFVSANRLRYLARRMLSGCELASFVKEAVSRGEILRERRMVGNVKVTLYRKLEEAEQK